MKQQNKNIVGNRDSGFTLIELIVVIVILAILAAIALPKFADLGKDARVASVNGARGALAATSAMAHGKYLVTSPPPTTVAFEGSIITFAVGSSGYPKADAGFAAAAGLNPGDYNLTVAATTLTVSPVSAPTAATCSIVYAEPVSAFAAPTLTLTTTGC